MKKKDLLVLGEFTNGHRAAAIFAKERGWTEGVDFEFAFRDTHELLVRELAGNGLAVVPIFNSTVGEIAEVTHALSGLRKRGMVITEKGRLELPVEHCLLVPAFVQCATEVKFILSHEKAFEQCSVFLGGIGVLPMNHLKRGSTGEAAKFLSGLGVAGTGTAAISTREAAEGYDLKVLLEGIQDDPDNKTTFVLLESGS